VRLSLLIQLTALLLACIVALAASAPAHLLARLVPQEQLVMTGFQGTLWRGSASRCLLRLPPGYVHLGEVRWSLAPASLLSLAPRVQVGSSWGDQTLQGELRLRGASELEVAGLEVRADAALVQQFAPLAIDGRLELSLDQLRLRDGLPHSGRGRAVWRNAGFIAPRGRVPLGSYAVDFAQPPGEALRAQVITLAGPLRAEGRVELRGRQYLIDVLLDSERELDPQLQQALSLMAAPEGDGYRIEFESRF